MKIITGSTGTTHVTSNNDGEFNQGIFGKNLIVLDNGSHLSAAIIDNNTVRVSDGDLIYQGRHALIEPNTTEDITIETGTVGINRNDLIVARYALDSSTGYENITLEVVKGEETSGTAADPEVTTGDIRTGDLLAEVALYRVKIEGINIVGLESLYTVTKDIISLIADLQKANGELNTNISGLNSDLTTTKNTVSSHSTSLNGSFKSFTGGSVRKFGHIVLFRFIGIIENFTANTPITHPAKVPSGYRPNDMAVFPIVCMAGNEIQGHGRLNVAIDGTITYTINITGSATQISIDTCYYVV